MWTFRNDASFNPHCQCKNQILVFLLEIIMASLIAQSVKKSACNAGDPGSVPGSGRSPGEGIGYLLQYSWASLVAQLVKNPPATQETWVQSVGWEDPLEKGKATHSSILAWRIPGTLQYSLWGQLQRVSSSMGLQGVRTTKCISLSLSCLIC